MSSSPRITSLVWRLTHRLSETIWARVACGRALLGLAQSLAQSLIEETTGMRPQVSQDGDEVTFTPSTIEPR